MRNGLSYGNPLLTIKKLSIHQIGSGQVVKWPTKGQSLSELVNPYAAGG